jgi:hypothetical protein
MWIAQESRPFIELDGYVGPDRRFQNVGPPDGHGAGRRRADKAAADKKPSVNIEDAIL